VFGVDFQFSWLFLTISRRPKAAYATLGHFWTDPSCNEPPWEPNQVVDGRREPKHMVMRIERAVEGAGDPQAETVRSAITDDGHRGCLSGPDAQYAVPDLPRTDTISSMYGDALSSRSQHLFGGTGEGLSAKLVGL
jgi:hypothetical protein